MDGIIAVHKPQNITSHDVVQEIRNIIQEQKVGHFGTLDPMATGLLLIAVGKATRLFPFFSEKEKVYQGRIKLGFATDTYDATGTIIGEETSIFPDTAKLLQAMHYFEGRITQTAPLFSAKKYKGKPLYTFARKNQDISIEPHSIQIEYFHLMNYDPPLLQFEVLCSSGTYIRSLANDLGRKLGCGAHLAQLIRTRIGPYELEDAMTLESIREDMRTQQWGNFIFPLESLLPHFPKIILTEAGRKRAQSGGIIQPVHVMDIQLDKKSHDRMHKQDDNPINRLFSPDGKLIAFAKIDPEKGGLHPFLVIDTNNQSKVNEEAK